MTLYRNNELTLYGAVGDYPGEECFTALQVREALAAHGRQALTVLLNSGGGSAYDGIAIYNTLKALPAPVHVVVDGIAASAASLIAMAGSTITMRLGSNLMIHDPAGLTLGTAADHDTSRRGLEALAQEMAGIYARRSRKSVEAARRLMVEETWFTPAEAVAEGFADKVDDVAHRAVARFDYALYRHPPEALRRETNRAALDHAVARANWDRGLGGARKPTTPPRSECAARLGALVDAANVRRTKGR